MPYDPAIIEPKWQNYWERHQSFRSVEDPEKPKFYALDMFPYPSGAGLHVGHPEGYTATDIVARYKRMRGFSVLHPMGWDAFGLPAERAAIRDGIHPAIITKRNTDNFRRQIKRLGFSYDWEREVDTSSPDYYHWTQWIFLRLYERGLAYEAEIPVNWCPALGTVLANEEVSPEGTYKETGDPVEKRMMKQWMLRITAYAQRLIDDLEDLDWPEPVKKMQRDWIGRSDGAEIRFEIVGSAEHFTVFTTRPDTLFGATYAVLAPEHPLVDRITSEERRSEVAAYVERTSRRAERDRRADAKEKTGVFTGAYAQNPANGEPIPVWISDYVLMGYGTGAIMAVPAHDQRDFEFAAAMGLPRRAVVRPIHGTAAEDRADSEPGIAINSGAYDGLPTPEFQTRIVQDLARRGLAEARVQYALRDWLFSRQRYWGEPFPLLRRADGSIVTVPDECLPVSLPHLSEYKPTEDGRPPLARAREWVEVHDKATGERWERETNTMPQWAGSCWYYLRFLDPKNRSAPFDVAKERYWMPVDLYIGGTEHAVLHLLYARFWHKVLFDIGLVSTKEPFQKLFNQGMIRAWSYRDPKTLKYYAESDIEVRDGKHFVRESGIPVQAQVEKMGKSKLNVVNPDDVIDAYGADSMRLYEMFMGPLEMAKPWQTQGIEGVHRFLHRTWRLFFDQDDAMLSAVQESTPTPETERLLHATVAGVTEDVEALRFNTAISKMMEFVNAMTQLEVRPRRVLETFLRILAPFAPHLCEEVWERLGHPAPICEEPWPAFDPALLVEDQVEIPININGKVRSRMTVPRNLSQDQALALALRDPAVQKHLDGRPPRQVIYRADRMINLVV